MLGLKLKHVSKRGHRGGGSLRWRHDIGNAFHITGTLCGEPLVTDELFCDRCEADKLFRASPSASHTNTTEHLICYQYNIHVLFLMSLFHLFRRYGGDVIPMLDHGILVSPAQIFDLFSCFHLLFIPATPDVSYVIICIFYIHGLLRFRGGSSA